MRDFIYENKLSSEYFICAFLPVSKARTNMSPPPILYVYCLYIIFESKWQPSKYHILNIKGLIFWMSTHAKGSEAFAWISISIWKECGKTNLLCLIGDH